MSKEKYNELLEEIYKNKKTIKYYSSKEIMDMLNVSERTMRYRLNQLKIKYKDNPTLLVKKNNKWNIHYSIADEFQSKYRPRIANIYNIKWKSYTTWNMLDSFTVDYHEHLINEVKDKFPEHNFHSSVAKTKIGVNFVRLISDVEIKDIKLTVLEVIKEYLPWYEFRVETTDVFKNTSAIEYLKLKQR